MRQNNKKTKSPQTGKGLSWCENWTEGFLLVLLSGFVLICGPYERIVPLKYRLFLGLGGGYLVGLWLLVGEMLLMGQLRAAELRERLRRIRGVSLLVGVYLLFTTLSAVFSPYSYNRWMGMSRYEGLLTQLIYCGIFLSVALFGRLTPRLLWAFGLSMLGFCGLCGLQFLGLNPLGLYPQGYSYYDANLAYSGVYLGTVGNADLVTGLLAMAILIFLSVAVLGTGRSRWLALAPLGACTAVLLQIRVAGGILAVAVAVALLIPLWVYQKQKPFWKWAAVGESLLLLLGLMLVYGLDFGGSGTLYELHELLHGRILDSFGSSRIFIWRQVLEQMPQHLWFGTGPDSMAAWPLEGFQKYVEALGQTVYRGIDLAHNDYLNVAAQQGILAGAVWLLLHVTIWAMVWKGQRSVPQLICAGAVLAYEIQAFFEFSMCMVTPVFFVFWGLMLSEYKTIQERKKRQ